MNAALAVALAAAVSSSDSGPKVEGELAFAYGFAARMSFGGLGAASVSWKLWDSSALDGWVDVGVMGGLQTEPYALTASLYLPSVVTGSSERLEVFGTGGLTLRLLSSRRLILGVQVFAGWTRLWMRGAVSNENVGMKRDFGAVASEFTTGTQLKLGVRLTEHVTLMSRFIAPLPYAGVAISPYFMASLGVTLSF